MDANDRVRWRPLLDGDDAIAARAAVDDIAAALAAAPGALDTAGLSRGNAGRALFWGYLAEVWPERGFDEPALHHLERAIDQMAEHALREALYSGFTGVAWVSEHLQAGLLGPDDGDPNLELDELLCQHLATTPWRGDYDLISGLAGCAVYGLERLPRPSGVDIVTRVVDRLRELAVHGGDGVCWLRRPELLLEETRARSPDGVYDLGAAHGVPGVVAVLAGAVGAGVAGELARPLLAGAWQWLMAQRLPADAETTFGYSAADQPAPSRNAWCYGDPGVAAAMYAAARRVGDAAWAEQALAIARRAAARPAERCGCVDAGLCHGTAGLAHIYNRLWQDTGEPVFGDAARAWYQRTLALRQAGKGIAGFQTYYPGPVIGQPVGWIDDGSFLTGTEGIALALVAAITPVEPAWDRLLLASLRGTR